LSTGRRFNAANISVNEYVLLGGGWHGYDVERLYTNIELTDLVDKLSQVMEWAWQEHIDDGHSFVLVFWQHHQHLAPQWYPSLAAVKHDYGLYNPSRKQGMKNDGTWGGQRLRPVLCL